ncbi:MAG: hypothetical protein M1814_001046 [Vezdaea aestivalis]|nr:MAG: hypothetical protein M1814_001046 [Vezdaea aestivalis]
MSDGSRSPLLKTGTRRDRPAFLARTATDDASQLDGRSSVRSDDGPKNYGTTSLSKATSARNVGNPYEPLDDSSSPQPRPHFFAERVLGYFGVDWDSSKSRESTAGPGDPKSSEDETKGPKMGALPRPVGGSEKLGTFSGVFVPTSLNVLSILMFLRFGFILGQSGVLGMMGMLVASYLINLITTLSISAIATNGTVRGGGAYYLISRSLGPEFGGSIGVVLYLGFVFNTGMNAVGLIDCLKQNFGVKSGDWYRWLPEGNDYNYLWATIVLIICTGICLAGSGLFARASNGLLVVLLLATFSIPFSALVRQPFSSAKPHLVYTGISRETFLGNLLPKFTRGAAGSDTHGRENFQTLFGILFPATGGIFAGASMSGDLKHPSKAIPKGTLSGLGLTFFAYTVVILAMAGTITRQTLYDNVNVIQDTNLSAVLILLGEVATSLFSVLMGVIGSAKLLQALSRDNILPGFLIFGQGTKNGDEPTYAIIFTHVIAQVTMLFDINRIASFVTMTYLMTFLVTNLACFLLKLSSAPNFRPSFVFFNAWTAGVGTIVSGVTMFFVDGQYASGCVGILIVLFILIHYTSPPKSWGDVSQSLIFHQVRKYLLRLRQEHVKFWRPQILLFINNPRHQYKLMKFCNSMKKGGLYILGHVIVNQDFGNAVPEARRQQAAWTKFIDFSKVKAFVNIVISPAVEWGVRSIILSAGLGGMRPNIAVLGFYNLSDYRDIRPPIGVSSPPQIEDTAVTEPEPRNRKRTQASRTDSVEDNLAGHLPTDVCRTEGAAGIQNYLTILEDMILRIQINVAVARGFNHLAFPNPNGENTKKYIDLWPIQMSAEVASVDDDQPNVLTTNFDTYTLILQLGCILRTVKTWKDAYQLRVAVFVEYETDVDEERRRVKSLLDNLRIKAEVSVFWLASGTVLPYEYIVNGKPVPEDRSVAETIDKALADEEWWDEIETIRGHRNAAETPGPAAEINSTLSSTTVAEEERQQERFQGLRKLLRRSKRRHTMQGITKLGVNLGMRTHNLDPHITKQHAAHASASEDSDSSSSSSSEGFDGDEHRRSSEAAQKGGDNAPGSFWARGGNGSSPALQREESSKSAKSNPTQSAFSRPFMRRKSSSQTTSSTIRSPRPQEQGSEPGQPAQSSKDSNSSGPQDTDSAPNETKSPSRPKPPRRASHARFSSNPVPRTKVASTDDLGPSIMFTPSPPPATNNSTPSGVRFSSSSSVPLDSSPQRSGSQSQTASAAMALSFNDLPCRAQHLILNDLMRSQSADTAVLFTTLPAPVEGTCQSEEDSVRYLTDLETLCEGFPPTMLVHSNSMTVTMNL